ncbi:hypothetical protein ARSEF1564_010123 [Beauveria bassiana]
MTIEWSRLYNSVRQAAWNDLQTFQQEQGKKFYILGLPDEVILGIAKHLTLWDQCMLSQVFYDLRAILDRPLYRDTISNSCPKERMEYLLEKDFCVARKTV